MSTRASSKEAEMYRVTTPTHTFTLPIETSECSAIQVTYKQSCKTLVKLYSDGVLSDGMTINGKDVIINLLICSRYIYSILSCLGGKP